jgi:formamidopyrimidine-DNA glycosylase
MPEGPEVWILNEAINLYYGDNFSQYIGKHIIIENICWSFGLKGKIKINEETNELFKPSENDWIHGVNEVFDINFKFGLDWLTCLDLSLVIEKFKKSKSKLGSLLINQKYIAGIGVAWGSEILHRAGLRPDIPSNCQDLSTLLPALYSIREEIKQLYLNELENKDNKEFINSWFENLYKIRDMKVYKKGEKIDVGGRSWYI